MVKNDKIYFGPIESVSLLNGGKNYDVINPPIIQLSSAGAGTTNALIQPVISGEVTDIQVDPQDFDIKKLFQLLLKVVMDLEQY